MKLRRIDADLRLLSEYMNYWIDKFNTRRISFEQFKEKAQAKRETEIVQKIRAADKKTCTYCKSPIKGIVTVDHIVPTSRGGKNVPENKVFCCKRCNTYKDDSTLTSLIPYLEREIKKPSRRGVSFGLDEKTCLNMLYSFKKIIKEKKPIMKIISEYESSI